MVSEKILWLPLILMGLGLLLTVFVLAFPSILVAIVGLALASSIIMISFAILKGENKK